MMSSKLLERARTVQPRCGEDDFRQGRVAGHPAGPFNSSLEGNVRRAIDFREGDGIDEEALEALVRTGVALNTSHNS